MNCPKCDHATLEEVEVQSIRVDRCPQCEGTWYDPDELRQLTDRESNGDYRWMDVGLWQDAAKVAVDEHPHAVCPKDGAAMATVRYSASVRPGPAEATAGKPEIAVEVCPVCFGLWLDKGDYERIVARFEERVDSETFTQYLAEMEEEFVELLSGKEGIKKELSDLGKVFYLLRLRFAVEHPVLVKIKEALRHLFPE